MLNKTIRAIHDLKIFFLAVIIVSFLYNLGVNPIDIVKFIGAEFTSAVNVSGSASVRENPINSLALQLKNKEVALAQKEQSLQDEEASLQKIGSLQNNLIIFLSIGIVILFILIILNYYLDYRRRKKEAMILEQIKEINDNEKNNKN
jgi:hypothetical protein